MIHLYGWLRDPAGQVSLVGEIRVADPDPVHGALRGEFRYDRAYLESSTAFALDPVHLTLDGRIFSADRPRSGIHGIFEDSLPDDWGRGVVVRQHQLPRGRQSPPYLLAAMGRNCLGALTYTSEPMHPEPAVEDELDLETIVEAACRYDKTPEDLDVDDWTILFKAASSPGGARPKVLISSRGQRWIAKLPSSRDEADMVRIEATCLSVARQAGIKVPDFRVEMVGERPVLMVKRFDVRPERGRYHVASLQTLLGAEGFYQLGYADVADVVRRVSRRPEVDLPALFRQAAFNAMIGNTDDHLKNFSMLRDEKGWILSPAYDLLPDIPRRQEHVLRFGICGHRPTLSCLEALGHTMGISVATTTAILAEVAEAVSGWSMVARAVGLDDNEATTIEADIHRRIGQINAISVKS